MSQHAEYYTIQKGVIVNRVECDKMPYLYIDPIECTGCRQCELYCSLEKEGVFNPRKARCRVVREEPVVDYVIACRHCKVPPCKNACPVDAISRDDEKDLVTVDPSKCIGCAACVEACPFGAMFFNPTTKVAINCDRCMACIPHCPVGTLKIRTAEEIASPKRVIHAKRFAPKMP